MSDAQSQRFPESGRDEAAAQQAGVQFLLKLAALLRTGRTHDVTNQAFQRQLRELLDLIASTFEETGQEELALISVADYFYLNGTRIRAQASMLPIYHWLMNEFERRSIGGLRFLLGVRDAEVERFFQLFLAAEDSALAERFAEMLHEASIEHIVPVTAAELDASDLTQELDKDKEMSERGRAKRVFWSAVLATRRVVVRAAQSGRPDLRQAKRLVQPVVDSIMKHEYSVVGLTALKDHDEYTYAHCVNVSILSIGMGQALGLPRQVLADLGVAGLLHDVGKIAVPGDVLRKPAKLDPDEWKMVQRHPQEGVKMMARMPGLTPLALDSMRVCFEHHMNYDRTGYPDPEIEWGQATMSRIVAVADCFDAITAHRAYHKRARAPFEGLQYLLGPIRVNFDPAVLWALVKTVGLYPAGTVLQTDSGHVVMALSPNPNDPRRPVCRVLVHPDGTQLPTEAAEEWNPMPPERRVLRVIPPEEANVDTAEQLAA